MVCEIGYLLNKTGGVAAIRFTATPPSESGFFRAIGVQIVTVDVPLVK